MKEIIRLYYEFKTDLYHYLLGLTHDSTLADDLLSDTFLQAIISLPSFRGESSIKTWLFGIARNLWLQHLRKHKSTINIDEMPERIIDNDLLQGIVLDELAKRVKALLSEKDSCSREVFIMRMNGYSYKTIAETLKISESTARVIEFRTRKWLQAILSKEDYI
ncbi:MAG: polymerase sigma factor, sigma-70 family [Firmicutes bacterium]|nr:polymerase sigma factor, sigma-70 family [Bacillota bacterium]